MRPLANRRAQRGMAVVAVMVLISVLFFGGAVMALAVSSNLHTVDILASQDAVHYAAESAVARGAGALLTTQPCQLAALPPINGRVVSIWCSGGPTDDESPNEDSTKPATASIPSLQLTPGACTSTTLPSLPSPPRNVTAWTVIGLRGSGDVDLSVWTDGNQTQCSSSLGTGCGLNPVLSNVVYVRCQPQSNDRFLHIASRATPIFLGTSVVRLAPRSDHSVRTVVGASGFEVDEADIVLGNGVTLWNTVLP